MFSSGAVLKAILYILKRYEYCLFTYCKNSIKHTETNKRGLKMEPFREKMVQGCMINILAVEFTDGSCKQRLHGKHGRENKSVKGSD
jgi:hypothetical protein